MPIPAPTFTLNIGTVKSSTASPVAGPSVLMVERDMDLPADALRVRLADRAGIVLDDEVTLQLGQDGDEKTVFTGNVVALRPAIGFVEIQAIGKMNKLLNLRTTAVYEGQAAGSIAQDLIGQAGLSPGTLDDGPTLPVYTVDSRVSAFAHLKDLADSLGYELYTDRDGNVMFHGLGPSAGLDSAGSGLLGAAAGAATGAVKAVAGGLGLPGAEGGEGYAFAKHLLDAEASRRSAAWGAIDVGGESPMSGRGDATAHWLTTNDSDYRGTAGEGEPRLLVLDPAARTKDLADRFAAGRLAVAARKAYEIEVQVLGRPQVDLGDSITASDAPEDTLNGSGYVRAISHRFGGRWGFVSIFRISVSVS